MPLEKRHIRLMTGLIAIILFTGVLVWQSVIGDGGSATKTLGETMYGRTVAFFHTEQDTQIIWQPATNTPPLIVQSITTGSQVDILPYPDVNPIRWQVAPAENKALHIVWLEQDGRLRNAVISATGETQRGPITLAFESTRDFVVLPLTGNRLFVLWRTPNDQQITAQVVDAAGRPESPIHHTLSGLHSIVAVLDRTGTLHLSWISLPSPNTMSFYYHTTMPDSLTLDSPLLLHTQEISSTEVVTDLMLNLDETHAYLTWGLMIAEPATIKNKAHILVFPLEQPAITTINELRIPQHISDCHQLATSTRSLGHMCDFESGAEQTTSLRWLGAAPGQHDIVALIAAIHTVSGWQPGIMVFQDGLALGYRLISTLPADAGVPAISIAPSGQLIAAWSSIAGAIPKLYAIQLG